jgi:hypothetical protein
VEEKWRAIDARRGAAVVRVEERSIFTAGLIGEAIVRKAISSAKARRL